MLFLFIVLMPVNKVSKQGQSSRVGSANVTYMYVLYNTCMYILLTYNRHLRLATMVWEGNLILPFQYPFQDNALLVCNPANNYLWPAIRISKLSQCLDPEYIIIGYCLPQNKCF